MAKIGSIDLGEFPLLLAPMEDVSDPPFRALCKENGADVSFWDGTKMEFEDSSFENIVSKSALTKLRQTDYDTVIEELVRISKPKAIWYISPPYMVSRSLKNMGFENAKKILQKGIKIMAWDYPREQSRFADEELKDQAFVRYVQENKHKISFDLGEVEINLNV